MCPFPKEPGPPDYSAYLCSPAELKASYDHCRDLRVPVELERPRKILPKTLLALCLAENSLLLTCAEEVITLHHYTGLQKGHIYILCDPELAALKIFAVPEVLLAAAETGVRSGTVFTEASCGTNALALTREHNRLVAIRGEQHYCKLFKDWWCVAGPIKDPEGRILGYLGVSMHAKKELGLTVALLQTLVNSIEREFLLLDCYQTKSNNNLPPAPPRIPLKIERELTRREQEVLTLLCYRLTNREIAERLHLSPSTIETYCKRIYQKLAVKGRVGLLSILDR
ncbi:MAG: LuxR C-terminal-related transcriptional regulator [Chloroflexota bacterium]